MDERLLALPPAYRRSIEQLAVILKEAGCTEVFLFGSLAEGKAREGADIDIAVRGCPRGKFFQVLGKLLLELEHPVDLVNLDGDDAFSRYLELEGTLVRVA